MFPTPNRRYITLAGAILFLEWMWVLLGNPGQKDIIASLPSLRKVVKEDIFDYPFVESNVLKHICDSTEWSSRLIFTCEDNSGDVADVRNSILNCLRFTIAAGGRLVAPRIIVSNNEEGSTADSAANRTDVGYMFDLDHFLMSLHLSCPQLNTYKDDLQSPFPPTGIPSPETWGAEFRNWLDSQTATRTPARGIMVVNLARSPPVYPISSDEASLAHEFGAFLKIQPEARRLATSTFHALIDKHHIDAAHSDTIAENAYVGAFLDSNRATGDPSVSDVTRSSTTLSQSILDETLAANLSVLYLVSSDPSSLATTAPSLGIRVATKFELLPSQDSAALQVLAPEQQALVDYLVLGRASQFMGVGGGAFGWGVALGRGGKWTRDGGEGMEGELMRDSLSRIYGEGGGDEFASCLWP
ncbi:hypothetical protein ACLOAV_004964 [Pseudogymnoascus australis]